MCGIMGNSLILRECAKLGVFNSTINVSCLALAVSDLCCVLACMLSGLTSRGVVSRQVSVERTPSQFSDFVGRLPNMVFSRTTALVTAWISLERCLCVALPTKVKVIITRRVTTVMLAAIFIICVSPMVLIYVAHRLQWQFNRQINSTILMVVQDDDTRLSGSGDIDRFLYGVIYPMLSLASVSICTAILVVKLKENARWREVNAPGAMVKATGTSAVTVRHAKHVLQPLKEKRITKVVVMVTGLFLVLSLPMSANVLASAVLPGYSASGTLRYLFLVNGMVCVLLTQLNSSLNIIIFAISGQKFRDLLLETLPPWRWCKC